MNMKTTRTYKTYMSKKKLHDHKKLQKHKQEVQRLQAFPFVVTVNDERRKPGFIIKRRC